MFGSQRMPVDVRVLAASAQGQRLVMMVVTGSPNRRSARWGRSARSQCETGRGSVATMILVEPVIGEHLLHGLHRLGTAQVTLDGDTQRTQVSQHLAEPLPGLRARLLIGGGAR
jgi:hypothetical protein